MVINMAETKEKKALLDDIDDGDLILQDARESIPLTKENAIFTRSAGGLISLRLKNQDGEEEFFERVVLLRAFPMTCPDEFLIVREADGKGERGKEIGSIRHITDFDAETVSLFSEELQRRYFTPTIYKINSVKEKFGYFYWDSETSAGHITFILNNPFSNVRLLEDGRVFIYDIDGNSFCIPDASALDKASYRRIEIYL